jgi:methylated-DNA-protein-cysteine methyltransferase related protein
MNSTKQVFNLIRNIPKGRVLTYKQVAKFCQLNSPRLVGKILHLNTDPLEFPCHRVVKSSGEVATGYAFGGKQAQLKKLKQEGVIFVNSRINLSASLWKRD